MAQIHNDEDKKLLTGRELDIDFVVATAVQVLKNYKVEEWVLHRLEESPEDMHKWLVRVITDFNDRTTTRKKQVVQVLEAAEKELGYE